MESTQVTDSMTLVPVFITNLEFLTEEGANHEILGKFAQGRVYKCYLDNKGTYFLFPGEGDLAWLMPQLSFGTENYNLEFAILTPSNFTEYDILDEDLEFLSTVFQSDIKKEIAIQGGKEVANSLDMTDYKEQKENTLKVDEREIIGVFKVLNQVNPRVARGLVEFSKYATVTLQADDGLDGMMLNILTDEDLGKGACISGAMNNLLRYSQSDEGVRDLLTAAMHILIELSRNVKKNG